MIATLVSPEAIPAFVHPPVPGESHDLYGDTHLDSIKLPTQAVSYSPGSSSLAHAARTADPLGIDNALRTSSSSSTSPHESSDSMHEPASGATPVTGAGQHEGSSDDFFWAKFIEGCTNGRIEHVQEILLQAPQLKDSIDNISSATGMNPLHFAASRGHEEIVRILIDQAGAGVDVQDREGETALLKASYAGHYAVVCLLLKRGANIHQRDKDGWTALHNASSKGFIDIAQVLLEKGEADINTRSKMGHTPLINASSKGDVAMVLYFLNHAKANPLLKNTFSEMAYDVAAANSEAYLCDILQSSEKQRWKEEYPSEQIYEPLAIHSTVLQTVHENQRAASSFPLSLMTPKFSAAALTQQDICGPWSLPNGRPSTKDDVHLPLIATSGVSNPRSNQRGWFWLTEWVIDKTDPIVDSEGWQYGKSLTDTNQQWSAIPPTSGGNWVRRRKWVRVMKKRVDLVSNVGNTSEELDAGQGQLAQELAGNYIKRAGLALRLDDGFANTAQELMRYRQAIQILLYGIKGEYLASLTIVTSLILHAYLTSPFAFRLAVDKDPASKQSASVLVREHLLRAEELADIIQQREAALADVEELETPRPQIESRSSTSPAGLASDLRNLTLQRSRPTDMDTLESMTDLPSGLASEAQSEGARSNSFSSASNALESDSTAADDIDRVTQEEDMDRVSHEEDMVGVSQEEDMVGVSQEEDMAEVSQEDMVGVSREEEMVEVSQEEDMVGVSQEEVLPDAEVTRDHQQSDDLDGTISTEAIIDEEPATIEPPPLESVPDSEIANESSPASSIPIPSTTQQVPTVAVINASPAARPVDPFPMARLTRNPRSTMTSSSSQGSAAGSPFLSQNESSSPATAAISRPRMDTDSGQMQDTIAATSAPAPTVDRTAPGRAQSRQTPQHANTQPPVEAKWEQDHKVTECRECHRKFSLWVRRHHCRRCGHVICDRCSSHRAMLHPSVVVFDPTSSEAYLNHQALARRGTIQSYRVCDSCFTTYGPGRSIGFGGGSSSSAASASGSGSATMQTSVGSSLHYHRSFHGHASAHPGPYVANQASSAPAQHDAGLGVYMYNSGYAPDRSHSSSRSSSSSNLHPAPMMRNASSSSLMSECPVCGAVLAGLEGGKAAQEAHVQECLEDTSGQGSGPVRYVGK
ncbi:hypothetical protein BGZ99_008523 [Dissophora globulifera]|uniref:FYVE-type domain-containing protein n=1 Tax=Dissophora globulifera TaxID=979702 RepID=A0A9P6UPP9_9FUNG|nr:hypothetical protein BGZ99_008523 [Dissophora globulifera]